MNLICNNLTITSLIVSKCLSCVFVHSHFIKNPLVDLETTNPSFLRWFCHSWYQSSIGAKYTLETQKTTTILTMSNTSSPYKDYNSLLGGKQTVFTFYNYRIVLAKVSHVILRLFWLILLFMRLILLFVAFVGILGLWVLILLFMTYFGCLC
jgi:hypothetical protein